MATLDQLSAWMCSDIAAKEGHSCISTVLEQPLVTCSSAPCSSDHSESDGMQSDEARDDVATWPEKKAAGWSARDATGASSARGGQHQSQPLQLPQQQSLLCTAVGEAGARPRRSTGDLVASLLARTCQVAGSTGSDLVGPGPGPLQPAPQLEPPPEIDGSDGGGLLTAASLRAPSSVPVAADATATWGLQPNPVDEARQLYSQSNPATCSLHTSSPQRDSQADHLSAQPMDIDHETGDDAAARPAEEDTSRPDQQQQQNLMCAAVGEAGARPRRSTGDLVASLLAHTGADTSATYTPINCTGGGDGLRRVTTSDNRLTQDAGGEVVNSKPASSPSWVARLPPVISCFASPVVMLLPFISPSALFENLTQNFSKIVEPAK